MESLVNKFAVMEVAREFAQRDDARVMERTKTFQAKGRFTKRSIERSKFKDEVPDRLMVAVSRMRAKLEARRELNGVQSTQGDVVKDNQ